MMLLHAEVFSLQKGQQRAAVLAYPKNDGGLSQLTKGNKSKVSC
jgi:hypothetical protein